MGISTDVITGVNACVSGVPTMGFVEIERTIDSTAIADSAGKGGMDRVPGNVDFTGKIFAYGYKPPSGTFPNKTFTLDFTQDSTDVTAVAGVIAADVRCIGLEIMVPAHDKTGKNAIFYIIHFGANGTDLSYGSATSANTVPTKYPSKNMATYLDTVRQTYCQWAHLMISAEVEPKVNSDSNGVYFRPAGQIDWKYTYNREVKTMSLLPALNTIHPIRMQTGAGGTSGGGTVGYWALNYGMVTGYKAKIDHASRLPISYDVELEKCSLLTDVGSITDPDGAQMWPVYAG